MKRPAFLFLFIGTHVLFIVLQIHKHTLITKLSYQKQKHESDKVHLEKKKQDLVNQLYALADRSDIKKFAASHLHLQPITLSQVKKISP